MISYIFILLLFRGCCFFLICHFSRQSGLNKTFCQSYQTSGWLQSLRYDITSLCATSRFVALAPDEQKPQLSRNYPLPLAVHLAELCTVKNREAQTVEVKEKISKSTAGSEGGFKMVHLYVFNFLFTLYFKISCWEFFCWINSMPTFSYYSFYNKESQLMSQHLHFTK